MLNVGEYFNSLLTLFDKGVEEGFIEKTARDIVILADYADLVNKMEVWYFSLFFSFFPIKTLI